MNSSFWPLGPRTRNSEMTNCPAVATAAGGSVIGETWISGIFSMFRAGRVLVAGAAGGTAVVVGATGVVETGSAIVGSAYAPNTITDGAMVLLFFFFLDLRDEEFLVGSAFAPGSLVWAITPAKPASDRPRTRPPTRETRNDVDMFISLRLDPTMFSGQET